MKNYMHSVIERRRGIAVFEYLGVYRDAMRIFLRDNIPLEIGVDLDSQVFAALPKMQREELGLVLDNSPRLEVIHAIDTKHFPRLVRRYWASLGRHFENDRGYINRMENLHAFRNKVCHPEMQDVSTRCTEVCFRDVNLILSRTGPDGVSEMVQEIHDRLNGAPEQVHPLDVSNSEVGRAFEKVRSDVREVSELVDGLVDRHSSGHSDSRFAVLRQAGRKIAGGTQTLGNMVRRGRIR